MTSIEEGQSPSNDQEEWQDTHLLSVYGALLAHFSNSFVTFITVHTFFYKNKVYKNVETQFVTKIKNILFAEMRSNGRLFVIFLNKPPNWTHALKR